MKHIINKTAEAAEEVKDSSDDSLISSLAAANLTHAPPPAYICLLMAMLCVLEMTDLLKTCQNGQIMLTEIIGQKLLDLSNRSAHYTSTL